MSKMEHVARLFIPVKTAGVMWHTTVSESKYSAGTFVKIRALNVVVYYCLCRHVHSLELFVLFLAVTSICR